MTKRSDEPENKLSQDLSEAIVKGKLRGKFYKLEIILRQLSDDNRETIIGIIKNRTISMASLSNVLAKHGYHISVSSINNWYKNEFKKRSES